MGRLVLDPHGDRTAVRVGDKDKVTGWEYREERHGVLSQVAVRRRTTWGTQWVSDQSFIAQGGCARRVITVPNTTGTTAMRYTADYQLRAARRERVRMRITAAGAFLAWPGDLGGADGGVLRRRGAGDYSGAGGARCHDLRALLPPPPCRGRRGEE